MWSNLYKHVSFWCLSLDSHATKECSNIVNEKNEWQNLLDPTYLISNAKSHPPKLVGLVPKLVGLLSPLQYIVYVLYILCRCWAHTLETSEIMWRLITPLAWTSVTVSFFLTQQSGNLLMGEAYMNNNICNWLIAVGVLNIWIDRLEMRMASSTNLSSLTVASKRVLAIVTTYHHLPTYMYFLAQRVL